MTVKINGKPEIIDRQLSLLEYIAQRGLDINKIVVEKNLEIVPKENLVNTHIVDNDSIEIVSFVGGG